MKSLSLLMLSLALVIAVAGACADTGVEDGDSANTTQTVTIAATQPETTTTTQPAPAVLFIGNWVTSANGGADVHLRGLAASGDPPVTITTESLTFANAKLKDHWEIGQALDLIREGTWDVVVLQGHPQGLGFDEASVERFHEYARRFHEEIEKVGAETVLYMSWGFNVPDPTLTTEMIAQAHSDIGAELGAKVTPVGLAWQRSIQERPDLDLYVDSFHPSAPGTYLALSALYATIFDQTPVGLPYRLADMYADVEGLEWQAEEWQMSADDVAFLQRVAWETVVEYQTQQPEG